MVEYVETVVIFRKFKDDGEIIALFPEVPFSLYFGEIMCYTHASQHGGTDYDLALNQTVLATPEEYAELKKELEDDSYHLVIRKRFTTKMAKNLEANIKREMMPNHKPMEITCYNNLNTAYDAALIIKNEIMQFIDDNLSIIESDKRNELENARNKVKDIIHILQKYLTEYRESYVIGYDTL
jgi:hypothetical protein